jgi:hypothetical protein
MRPWRIASTASSSAAARPATNPGKQGAYSDQKLACRRPRRERPYPRWTVLGIPNTSDPEREADEP